MMQEKFARASTLVNVNRNLLLAKQTATRELGNL